VLLETVLVLGVFGQSSILTSFGFAPGNGTSAYLYVMMFYVMYQPYSLAFDFFENWLSRRCEYQADEFAAKHGHGEMQKKALVTLFNHGKSPLVNNDWFVTAYYTHPSLIQRLQALDKHIAIHEGT
jgi:STE24 endopeptidase